MWSRDDEMRVVKTLGVVCEVTGTEVSEAALDLMVRKLSAFPPAQVVAALERCASECRFKITLADIVSRLDDGRPAAEEAWASFPKTEDASAVVTDEMSVAWGAAAPLYADGDQIAARMAFREVYERAVRAARAEQIPVRWRISAGFDKGGREAAALEAVQRRLLPVEHVLQFVRLEHHDRLRAAAAALPAPAVAALTSGAARKAAQ